MAKFTRRKGSTYTLVQVQFGGRVSLLECSTLGDLSPTPTVLSSLREEAEMTSPPQLFREGCLCPPRSSGALGVISGLEEPLEPCPIDIWNPPSRMVALVPPTISSATADKCVWVFCP